jgi:sec-independent protein translocase protein TatB
MPSFADDIVLAILALLLFGPKKLPVLARELGKWVGEFRRASNEFKYQMEEELRQAEQADRQKQIAAMESAAPPAPVLEATAGSANEPAAETAAELASSPDDPALASSGNGFAAAPSDAPADVAPEPEPLPIATSGSLNMMPPETGLPVARSSSNPMSAILDSIPAAEPPAAHESVPEAAHAD